MFYADLHIHSKYSRATSKNCNLEELALWGAKKGLSLISTGDFTHPAWFNEIKEKLVPVDEGVFKLDEKIEKEVFKNFPNLCPPRFLLSVEISTIYKKGDKTRKVHHVVFSPDLNSAQNFREKMEAIGNIKSDGRPILGLDSRNLLECVLESGEGSYIIPAHIWTPWFSVLGSKSGFDSIEECYEDLTPHIFALETGLSSDPYMNWCVSKLDRFRLVSNSDAHSPSKLAREATVFDCNVDYFSIKKALETGAGYVGTVEFFPEEGKYHEDGHRKCNVCLSPEETKKFSGICPVCHKPLTIGVLYRVKELADRDENCAPPKTAGKVFSLIPLNEIISEIKGVGPQSKSVLLEYERLIQKFGNELSILQDVAIDLLSNDSPVLAEAISRLRAQKVVKIPGYDGEYGVIKLFKEGELGKNVLNLKLDINIKEAPNLKQKPSYEAQNPIIQNTPEKSFQKQAAKGFDEFQKQAIEHPASKLLIKAGPGSGKTTVLTNRIARMVLDKNITPQNILAITFTKKAAFEMHQRLENLLKDSSESVQNINIHTFHSFCFKILKEYGNLLGLDDLKIITKKEKEFYKEDKLPSGTLDFDDLIIKTLELFSNYPNVLQEVREKYKYISVDEYQDIDEKQYELIRFLVPQEGNIFVIGDENQAIYGFRGGNSKFFNDFTKDYKDAVEITLKNNYRSTNNIVNASNQMMNSFNIISKYENPEEKIVFHKAPSDRAEAEFIVSEIEKLIGGRSFFSFDSNRAKGNEESEFSFSDFAILYRTKAQLPALIEALNRIGLPYANLSADNLCDIKPVKELLLKLNDTMPLENQLLKLKEEFKNKIEDYILNFLVELSKKITKKTDFIHEVSFLTVSDTLDKRADRISLMTLHASKGLEYKCVFIAGLEEGILPLDFSFSKNDNLEEIKEEQRLFYVGMTRAKERLYLLNAEKRFLRGTVRNLLPSRFLEKIKEDLLEFSKFKREQKPVENVCQLKLF